MITEISLSQPLLIYGWAFLTRQLDVFSLLSDSFQYYADTKSDVRLSKRLDILNRYLLLSAPDSRYFLDRPLTDFLDFDPNKKSNLPSLAYSVVSSYIVFGMLKKTIPLAIFRIETVDQPKLRDVINLVIDSLKKIKPLDSDFFISKASDDKFNMIAFMAKEDLMLALLRLKRNESSGSSNSLDKSLDEAYVKSFESLGLPKDIDAPFWKQKFSKMLQNADAFMSLKTRDFRSYNFLSFFFFLSDHFATYTESKKNFFNVFKEINQVLIHDKSIVNILFAFVKYTHIFFEKSDKDNASKIESRFLNKSCFAKKELSSIDSDEQDIDFVIGLYASNDFLEKIDFANLTFDPSIVLNDELNYTESAEDSDSLPDLSDKPFESRTANSQTSVSTMLIFGGLLLASGVAFYLHQKNKTKTKTKMHNRKIFL